MKGKYFLDIIDGELYSTDDFCLYWMYNFLFYDINTTVAKSLNRHPYDWTKLPADYWKVVTHHGKFICCL